MIVYDKEQKQIVIPNGLGNVDIYNNGVEAGYNQGYDQGQADMAAKARVIEITKNGVYQSKYSDSIAPDTVTGVYDDGTEFYNYAELNGDIFNTKIAATVDSRLEFWYKGDNNTAEYYDIIIGAADDKRDNSFQIRYYTDSKHTLWVEIDDSKIEVNNWSDTVWHHLIVSKAEGLLVDGEKKGDFSPTTNIINGEFFINGAAYDKYHKRTANGSFGMVKIDDVVIIPTADGFLNTNTGELLEVVKKGAYSYPKGELYKTINVNVPDLNGSYVEGYDEGYGRGYAEGETYGANMQKAKLGTITINENGQYERENGWNVVTVDVPDLNGSYDEGYDQGQADLAAKARVLDVTENGVYKSKFSDPIVPTLVTGVYADGTDFYNYTELNGKVFNTKIAATIDSRLEFWYKGDNTSTGFGDNVIIGAGNNDDNNCFQARYHSGFNGWVKISIGNSTIDINNWNDAVWHHLIVSKAEGLLVDGEKKGDFSPTNTINGEFYINGIGYDTAKNANGTFGMVKIDDVVFIPTANGFKNVNTDELLQVVKDGSYTFTENLPIYGEGELYKTVNVNIDVDSYYNNGYNQGKTDGISEQKSKLESINITENGTYRKEDGYNEVVVNVPDLNGSYDEGYAEGERAGYAQGKTDGVNEQKGKLSQITISENGTYTKEDGYSEVVVNVPDLNGSYDEGYNQGKTDGINEQKGKLSQITISENGTYTKEDGYSEVVVNVPDLNGSYNEGYEQGKTDGVNEQKGKLESINITENGTYTKEDGYNEIVVDVPGSSGTPKINVKEARLKFGNSEFAEIPEWADFEGVTDMENMFYFCSNLQTIPMIDTSNVTNMRSMFEYCLNLQTIPMIDTSNVTNMYLMFSSCNNLQTIPMINTSNAKDMRSMFSSCRNLQTIPMIDTSNATMMSNMFSTCISLVSVPSLDVRSLNIDSYNGLFGYSELPKLTDFGGFLNLKCSLTSDYNLKKLPNLTYESCINVLNGLYDFTGNGETPNSNQGQLKVHKNFLDKVGDEISIGTNKGWTITA